MKGNHNRLAALPSPITRQLHLTQCYLQGMRHISPRVRAAAFPLHPGELDSQSCWRK